MNMIKSVLFTCLVAAVSADAEADAAYLGYGYPYAYGGYGYAAHVPFGSSTGLDPITQGLDPVTQGAVPYYGLGYGGYHYGKRSADAEPEADAAYLGYGYPYGFGAYGYAAHVPFGSSTGLDAITQGLDPVTQGAVPYHGLGYAGYHYGKRSADAEPKADAAYLGYGYPYAYGGYGYAAHVPFGSSTGLDPITQGLDPVTQGAVPYYGLGYGGYHYGKRSADAEPEADAAYLGYGYPYAFGAYGYAAHVPFGSSTGLDPITQGLDPVTQGAVPYYGLGYGGYHYGK